MEEINRPTSRRALLAAAAGGVAAIAAQAAAPLTVSGATNDPVLLGNDNAGNGRTEVRRLDSGDAFSGRVNAMGPGSAIVAWSSVEAAVFAESSGTSTRTRSETTSTGIYGFSPAAADQDNFTGTGVWGDSQEIGVVGTGALGVLGEGGVGVEGDGFGANGVGVVGWAGDPGTVGVLATANALDRTALRVQGKIRFSRSGRTAIGAGKSSKVVTVAGVTGGSLVFAMMSTNRSGRWVRAVVPAAGKFTIYLNATVSGTTYVVWWILN